ncbi:MAG TPA: TonB-dependent receptor [Myxococcaceae bacterium]|nr:TonB-dependent receptor [Myxococcaceae bacterium]
MPEPSATSQMPADTEPANAAAAPDADLLSYELAPVVVTATRAETDVESAPASVSVISNEELRTAPVGDLSDAIRHTPGISLNAGSQGRRTISIRGMDSAYTLILIDGKRVNSSEAVFRHNDFDMSLIPVEAIERVEVVRGSMSALYGSEALGGVINIITKPVAQSWTAGIDLKAQTPTSGSGGQEGRASVYASGPIIPGKLGLRLTGAFDQRSIWHGAENPDAVLMNGDTPVTRPDGSTVLEGDIATLEGRRDHNGKAALVWTPTSSQTITAEYGRAYQTREGEYFIGNAYGNADAVIHRNEASLGHEGRWGWGDTTLRAYWEGLLTETDNLNQDNLVAEGNARLRLGQHNLTVGGEARWVSLDSTDFTSGHASVSQQALYVQDEWELHRMLTVLVGARLDHHETFGLWPTPRGYVVFQPTDKFTLKGGVGTGFRSPTLRQLSDESVTTSCRGACVIAGSADLDPETSINYELTASWAERAWGLSIGAFQNDITNLIDTPRGAGVDPVGYTDDGLPIFVPRNVNRARMRGLEATARVRPVEAVKLSANYTLLDARDLDEDVQLDNRPSNLVNAQVDWEIVRNLTVYGRGQYVGTQKSGDETVPAYVLFDAGLSWRPLENLGFNAGVLNIGNSRTVSEDGYAYQERGRTVFIGLNGRI